MDLLQANWPIILAVAVIAAILLFLLLRPRQRVRLSNDNVPLRPHLAHAKREGEGRGLAAAASAAASDITGQFIDARVHEQLPGASGPPDDLQRLKGVGPRFAEILNERGIIRFEQLAHLSTEETERLDAGLGPFRGRLTRDRVIDQADYLARGDVEGYEARFGKL